MRSKCFIQRCKTVILWNGSAFPFPTQFLRCNSRGNLSFHLNYYISSVGVILCDKRILLERGLPNIGAFCLRMRENRSVRLQMADFKGFVSFVMVFMKNMD